MVVGHEIDGIGRDIIRRARLVGDARMLAKTLSPTFGSLYFEAIVIELIRELIKAPRDESTGPASVRIGRKTILSGVGDAGPGLEISTTSP